MHYRSAAILASLALGLSVSGCSREASQPAPAATKAEVSHDADRAAAFERERASDESNLEKRVADVERKYSQTREKVVEGKRTPTTGLRQEVQEDVTNVRKAVDDLKSTTPDNWWTREEAAITRTTNDIEADVRRLAGRVDTVRPAEATATSGENVSTAPFTSRRDRLVTELHTRVEAMDQALDRVKADGARQTEVEDTRARVKKLGEDVDRLRSASADDWWNLSKDRVADYVDRVERSVGRLDDDKR